MGIPLTSGFSVNAPFALDERTVLSAAQMAAVDDAKMPSDYYALNSDQGTLYLYKSTNEFVPLEAGKTDAEAIGRYRLLKTGSGSGEFTVVWTEPQASDFTTDKRIIYAYIENDQALCDVYVGSAVGNYGACISKGQRFVGYDDYIAALLGLSLTDRTKDYNGWVNAATKTVYITNINKDYASVDALISTVNNDVYTKLGVYYTIGFDTDPEGNDMREYGKVIHHVTTP